MLHARSWMQHRSEWRVEVVIADRALAGATSGCSPLDTCFLTSPDTLSSSAGVQVRSSSYSSSRHWSSYASMIFRCFCTIVCSISSLCMVL